ncbi:glycosyltransferase family 2 protein, partial [Candidatus Gribaldobacteria bacterium]|nr:glycosyltransferase family 2 protein [Candidatus Gribaldobacteria bacterium]
MKIFIIILNYFRKKEIVACLNSIGNLKIKNYELKSIIIDNSSTGDSLSLKNKFPRTEFIVNKKNLGFAQGNNIGISSALTREADYVLLINNDALIAPGALNYLIARAQSEEAIGIVAPKIYFAAGYEYHKERYRKEDRGRVIWYAGGKTDWQNILGEHEGLDKVDNGQFGQTKEVEFISGCCMLIKKEIFQKIGLFDVDYFLYLEDMDFCVRAKKAGFKLLFAPKAIVWHKNLGTDAKNAQTKQAYYYTRNRLLFGFKYASLKTKLALV